MEEYWKESRGEIPKEIMEENSERILEELLIMIPDAVSVITRKKIPEGNLEKKSERSPEGYACLNTRKYY